MLWAWDIGDDIKKLERAKKVKIDVIDRENNKGKFIGSSGEIYRTNLLECTCVDFSVKKTFCKHMLRLAMELGVVNSNGRTPEQQEEYDRRRKNRVAVTFKERWAMIIAAFQVYGPVYLIMIVSFLLAALLMYWFLS